MRQIATLVAAVAALSLAGCNRNDAIGNDREAQLDPAPSPAPVMEPQVALANVAMAAIKPETMSETDLAVFGDGAEHCAIRLTEVAFPSFVYAPGGTGVLKLNGTLIPLLAQGEGRFAAQGLSVTLRPNGERGDAGLEGMDMIIVLPGAEEELGYSGFVDCKRRKTP